ncbi:Transcriptional regulator [Fructobacillus fructosus]|uniref:helix-turn-helix domain-containing protein n=1 Tax=Fructobacillus fructosus TaxID=1631 RepID=UPI002D946540|nr:Transcriptional regulator [Fructobacillus fructosus]
MKHNRIKELREKQRIGVETLGNKLAIPQSTLTRYENGNIEKGKLPIWQKIANYFNVSVDYLKGTDVETPSVTLKNDVPDQVVYKGNTYKVIKDE